MFLFWKTTLKSINYPLTEFWLAVFGHDVCTKPNGEAASRLCSLFAKCGDPAELLQVVQTEREQNCGAEHPPCM